MRHWTIEIKGHPIVNDDTYIFDVLDDVEKFVGKNDIQLDNIIEVGRTDHGGNVRERFNCIDFVHVSSTRLLLSKKE